MLYAVTGKGVGGFMMHPTVFVLDMENGEYSAKTTLRLQEGLSPAPIQMEIFDRTVNVDGEVVMSETESTDFIAYPAQTVLMPGEEQTVRFQWVGDGIPERERQYTIVARQVPIKGLNEGTDIATPTGSISAVLKFEGVLVLSSGEFRSDVSVTDFSQTVKSVSDTSDAPWEKVLQIDLVNGGTKASQELHTMKFRLEMNDGDPMIISPDFIELARIRQRITAGGRREIFIKMRAEYPFDEISSITPLFELE
jgi:hypothetical protein